MKDIEYEKDGVRKFAQERFKDELEAAGWRAVSKSKPKKKLKVKKDDNR